MNKDVKKNIDLDLSDVTEHDATEKSSKVKQVLGRVNWNLVKEGGKLGITGIFQFFGIISLFILPNVAFILYCVYVVMATEGQALPTLIYIILIGAIFVAYASVLAHKFVLIESVSAVYKHSSPLFRKVSEKIVDSAIHITTDKTTLTKQNFKKNVNISKLVHSEFGKLPRLLRAGMILILTRLPLAGMVRELQDLILSGNRERASEKLYQKMDRLISFLLSQNGVIRILLILLLNIVVSIFTIFIT